MKIPKVIYICQKTLTHINVYSRNWKKLNPEYEIKLYDDGMCEKFLLEEFSQLHLDIFKFIPDGPIKADFWRVCILYKYGGLYVDSDIKPLVPLRDYIEEGVDFVSCLSRFPNEYNPHFIMTNPNDEVMKLCIDFYLKLYEEKKDKYTYWDWSIVILFNTFLNFKLENSGIYDVSGRKFQFLKEKEGTDYHDHHCLYNEKRVLNNRYKNYDSVHHKFI